MSIHLEVNIKEKDSLSTADIEKVYSLLHIQIPNISQNINKDETFESIAASFNWPKMFYPSLYQPCKNSISSSANTIKIDN